MLAKSAFVRGGVWLLLCVLCFIREPRKQILAPCWPAILGGDTAIVDSEDNGY